MKVTNIKIRNIGIIADADIPIDKPLLVFYGEVMAGKSTVLQAVKWVLGGAFPADIIRHGEKEASVELGFDGGCVTRSWYRTKETEGKPSEIKARPVQFIRNGKPVPNPVAELKRLANPFLLDQDFLRNKTELDRKQFFAEQFAVDTTALDTELFNVQRQAQELRAKLSGYGDLDLTPVESVDTAALRRELAELRAGHQTKVNEWNEVRAAGKRQYGEVCQGIERANAAVRQGNSLYDRAQQTADALVLEIEKLKKALLDAQARADSNAKWMKEHPKEAEIELPPAPSEPPPPLPPDTSELEVKLQTAAAQNVRAEQYKKNLERDKARKADEAALKAAEDRARAIKKEKIAALSKVSETCGVPGLAFDEDGSFSFEGTAAGMLSTSQIMRLSSLLSALYPPDLSLGIELLDRGESLGRSIFDYVKHAESKKISVLATVVGQKPAQVPAKVGVWVVKDGVVLKDEEEKS